MNEGYWGGTENSSVADDIGFKFEPHYCDKVDKPGSFYASFAEAQLMCFFVRRNYLFRNPRDEPVKDDFLQLFLLQARNQRANIIISKARCCSCLALSQRIGLNLITQFSQYLRQCPTAEVDGHVYSLCILRPDEGNKANNFIFF